jgi:hypothetical protein
MLGRKIALITVVALGAALVGAAPAQAADRERAESLYNTDSPKTATATCPDGFEVRGAGARLRNGRGKVRLDSIVPTRTSVTVRGETLPGNSDEEPWSAVAAAICAPESDGLAQSTTIETGTTTAECPPGTDLSGAGFDLPSGSVLTGLIPDPGDRSVTVRTPSVVIGAGPVTAYAICVPEFPPSYTRLYETVSATDDSAPKIVTAGGVAPFDLPELTGVGGEITWVDTAPGPSVARSDVFIDTMLPNDDLTHVTVQAVDRTPVSLARMAADPEESWSVTGFALAPYYY